MAKKLRDIEALAKAAGGDRVPFESLKDQTITVKDVMWSEGEFGQYAVITYTQSKSKTEMQTSCGGEQVMRVLKEAEKGDLFPFDAKVKAFASKKFKGKFAYAFE